MDIANSVALVSGGSAGLGCKICRLLAAKGAKVIVGYRHGENRAQAVCQSIIDQGQLAKTVRVDLSDPEAVSECVEYVVNTFGGLDILVNNAGMASGGHELPPGDLEALTPEIWTELLNVNLSGPYYLT